MRLRRRVMEFHTLANPPSSNRKFGKFPMEEIEPLLTKLKEIGEAYKKTPSQVAVNWIIYLAENFSRLWALQLGNYLFWPFNNFPSDVKGPFQSQAPRIQNRQRTMQESWVGSSHLTMSTNCHNFDRRGRPPRLVSMDE